MPIVSMHLFIIQIRLCTSVQLIGTALGHKSFIVQVYVLYTLPSVCSVGWVYMLCPVLIELQGFSALVQIIFIRPFIILWIDVVHIIVVIKTVYHSVFLIIFIQPLSVILVLNFRRLFKSYGKVKPVNRLSVFSETYHFISYSILSIKIFSLTLLKVVKRVLFGRLLSLLIVVILIVAILLMFLFQK